MEQRTDEWFAARLGKITASRIGDVMAKPTTAAYRKYLVQLVTERLTGARVEAFTNAAMDWGTETEPQARAAYGFAHEAVVETGFVDHPTVPMSGASPDGLVSTDRLVEFKCPNSHTHVETLLSQKIPPKHQLQMLWQMDCTGRHGGCDYVSFDPRLPVDLNMSVVRFDYDPARAAEVRDAVTAFEAEVSSRVNLLRSRRAA